MFSKSTYLLTFYDIFNYYLITYLCLAFGAN